MAETETLYDRLGGEAAVDAAVDEFYDRVLADDSLAGFFEATDVDELRTHQAAFLTTVTGGPERYENADMAEAHDGLAITDEEFDRVATHLAETLLDLGVDRGDVEEVTGVVETLRGDVVSA